MITSRTYNQMSLRILVNKMSLLVADHDLTTPYGWIQVIKGHASVLFQYLLLNISQYLLSGACYWIRPHIIIKPVPCHDRIDDDQFLDGGVTFSMTFPTVQLVFISNVDLVIRGNDKNTLKHKQRKSCQAFLQ